MALVIPNIESITNGSNGYDFQSVPDATDWAARDAGDSGAAYVVTGMTVSQHTGSDMLVSIAAGTYAISGVLYTYAGGTATVSGASATDRRDIVSINAAGTVTVTAGTACGTAGWIRTSNTALPPVKPAIPAANVLLAEVAVPSSITVVANIMIVDKTVVQGLGIQVAYNPVTANYTSQPTGTSAWRAAAATSGTAPSVTLPNDGHLYRVEFVATYWLAATANDECFIGLGTSTTTILVSGIGFLNAFGNPVPTLVASNIVGSGQTISVYTMNSTGNGASHLITVGAGAGGSSSVAPSALAAYRVL